MDFEDQNGDLDGRGTGNERVYIDNVGYKANGQTVTVPLESTIYYRAYFAEGSGLYGPKLSKYVDSNVSVLLVQFRTITFEIVAPVTHNPVSGAQVYVDNVGYVANGGSIVVPAGCTVYHKANLGSTWAAKTSKDVDGAWSKCTYQWDGAVFSEPSYRP